MSKEKDKIFRTLEHIAITFDKLGYSPTVPIFKGHQDFEWLFKLELDTIKALCNQQDRRITELEEQVSRAIVPKFKGEDVAFRVNIFTKDIERVVIVSTKIEIICNINISYTIACLGENQTLADIDIRNIIEDFGLYISQEREDCLFATKEEAQAKLEELKGE